VKPFSQAAWACRCEWGPSAVDELEPADVTVVVDVFSFTTCVDVAVSRGVSILPYAWNDASAGEFARIQGAELAGRRRQARYSLAPGSYMDAPSGLRCVLPSPNGAQVTLAAARTAPVVLRAPSGMLAPSRNRHGGSDTRSTSFRRESAGVTVRCGRLSKTGWALVRF